MPVQSFNMSNPAVSQFAPQYSQPLTVQQRYQQAIAGRQQQPYVAPAPRIYGHQRQTQIPILDSASQMGNPMMQGYANNYMPPAPLPVAAPQQYNPGFGGYDQNARFSGKRNGASFSRRKPMSFGKGSSESSQQMDPQIRDSLLSVFNQGQTLSRTPYTPYNAARVAPMSPFQQQGMQATLDASRGRIGQQQVNQAINAAQGVAAYQPNNVYANQVGAANRVGDVNAGRAGGQQQVRSQNVPTNFYGRNARVQNINTGANAGNVYAGRNRQNFNSQKR